MLPNRVEALGYLCVRPPARPADPQVRRHEEDVERFCGRRGWELVALVRDIEGASTKGQPALVNAIERLRSGEANCLIVAEVTQLCPSVAEVGAVLEAIARAGARCVSLEPAFDTGTPVGRTIGCMLESVSSWERARRLEMTSAARAKATAAHATPLDLKRRVVRMRRANMTLQAIADELNRDGVPTLRGGKRWRPSSVQAMLGYKRPRRLLVAGQDE